MSGKRSGIASLSFAGRLIALVLLALVLWNPSLPLNSPPVNLRVLVDDSSSMRWQTNDPRWQRLMEQIAELPSDSRLNLIRFGRDAAVEIEDRPTAQLHEDDMAFYHLPREQAIDTAATDIEHALRRSLQQPLSETQVLTLLVSDGIGTQGRLQSVLDEKPFDQSHLLWWPALSNRDHSPVSLSQLKVPERTPSGAEFPLQIELSATQPASGRIAVSVNGVLQRTIPFDLTHPGTSELSPTLSIGEPGLHEVSVALQTATETLQGLSRIVAVSGPSSVLYLSERAAAPAAQALIAGGWPVTQVQPTQFNATLLAQSEVIIVDDLAVSALRERDWRAIADAVQHQGKGLVLFAGTSSFSAGAYRHSTLESVLPLLAESNRSNDPAAVVYLLDTSGSMAREHPASGRRRIDIARQAIGDSARKLGPQDRFALVGFNADASETIPMGPADTERLARIGREITAPDGGTVLQPAMQRALDSLQQLEAAQKLIVLVTDGHLEASEALAGIRQRLQASDVSVVALSVGGEQPSAALAQLSAVNEGRLVVIDDILSLPVLMSEELAASRAGLVREPVRPRQAIPFAFIDAPAQWPVMPQHMVTRAKKAAAIHLQSDKGDPLAASWQSGLGRVLSFSASLDSWSADWPAWGAFLGGLVEWTGAGRSSSDIHVSHRQGDGWLEFHADLVGDDNRWVSDAPLKLTMRDPAGTVRQIAFSADAPGRYIARLPAPLNGRHDYWVDGGNSRVHRALYRQPISERQQLSEQLAALEAAAAATQLRRIDLGETKLDEYLPSGEHGIQGLLIGLTLLVYLGVLLIERDIHRLLWRRIFHPLHTSQAHD